MGTENRHAVDLLNERHYAHLALGIRFFVESKLDAGGTGNLEY